MLIFLMATTSPVCVCAVRLCERVLSREMHTVIILHDSILAHRRTHILVGCLENAGKRAGALHDHVWRK